MPPKTIKVDDPAHLREYAQRAFAQAADIMFDVPMQRRRPDWHLAVQCILRADSAGLASVLGRISDVNAPIRSGTLLQIALFGAFPGVMIGTFPSIDFQPGGPGVGGRVERPDPEALAPGLACILALLDRGADPNRTHCDVPPLVFALVRGIAPALRLLVKRGATWAPFVIRGHTPQRNYEWSTLAHFMHAASHLSDDCLYVLENYRCEGCRRRLATQRCEGCMLVRYCCRECQESDWAGHRDMCRAAPPPTRQPRRP
jgi:hypothetical protein